MVFAIITLVASAALFMGISATYKVAGVGEEQNIKGYYAALAGARYANVILQHLDLYNPDLFTGKGLDLLPGQTIAINTAGMDLNTDLNLQPPHCIKIEITYNFNAAADIDDYTVKSTYS